MNVRWFIFLMLLVLVVGCRQRTFDCTLAEADAVMEHNADSAYTLLQQIPDAATSGNEATRARYTLLLTQATYKLYRPVPPDSLIQSAVAYYEQAADRHMLARAYYYRAMTLYERSRHDEAIVLLKQGEQIVRELDDLLQLSKYHESLCMVNYQAKCNDLMLQYAKQFLDDALQLRDSVLIARGLSHSSNAYIRLGKPIESVESILQTLPHLNTMDSVGKAYILTNIGCTMHENGNNLSAKHYLELSLNTHPRPNTYAELGNIYAEEGNEREAMNCWEKARLSDNPDIVLYTLNSIYNHYKQKNDLPNALATLEQTYHLKDSVNRASEKAEVAEIQLKYDKQVVENRYYKVLTWTFAGASFLLLVILLILFYHRHVVKVYTNNITKHLQTIQRIQQQIDQLEQEKQQYQSEQEKLAQAQTDLLALRSEQSVSEELLNQKEQEIKKLQASVEQYRKKIHALQSYAANERLQQAPVTRRLKQYLKESPYRLPEPQDWSELKQLINQELPSFYNELVGTYGLNGFEYDVCMLLRIQIPLSNIAKLKKCSPSNITFIRKELYERIFQKPGH